MLDFINTFSLEKLVVDNEICGMTFRLLEGIIHVDRIGSFTLGKQVLTDLLQEAAEGACPFSEDIALRSRYYLGKAYLWSREYDHAMRWFDELVKLDPEHPTWLIPWVWFRIGQTYDLMGRRDEALAAYGEVLDRPETGSLHRHARERLREPFTRGGG